jgi:hypothetical protein
LQLLSSQLPILQWNLVFSFGAHKYQLTKAS